MSMADAAARRSDSFLMSSRGASSQLTRRQRRYLCCQARRSCVRAQNLLSDRLGSVGGGRSHESLQFVVVHLAGDIDAIR